MNAIEFWVTGRPAPQGSKQWFPNGGSRESSRYVKPWRTAVQDAATLAIRRDAWEPLDEPCWLRVTFYITQPRKPKFTAPGVVPDLSKLIRATEDALTLAKVWVDDSRVVACLAEKHYATDREPGAFIRVSTTELRQGAAA